MSSVSLAHRNMYTLYFAIAVILAVHGAALEQCEVRARTTAGYVCGTTSRLTDDQNEPRPFASFFNVPYAKQPVGELRFQELQPPEPWSCDLDATQPGPVCPQTDILYGPLMKYAGGMSEECIHANIYVPLSSLDCSQSKLDEGLGLPILVFIHGGGFGSGSGDPDVYDPEYLVGNNGVIVITFNYRLNVFGFMSLNSSQIPGNNGLRDMITLLRWVKDNAVYFGGNPDDITLGGQSTGAISAHLLSLSPEAQGLFKRAIIMSGTAIGSFYTTSPAYAQIASKAFLDNLGINSTDPEKVHDLLTKEPLENIMESNRMLQDQFGLTVFVPTIDYIVPGVKAILPEEPETLLAKGNGQDIPLFIGYTNKEGEFFRNRLTEVDLISKIKQNLTLMAPVAVVYKDPENAVETAEKVADRYFKGEPTLDKYLKYFTDFFFQYEAFKVAKYRSGTGGAPTYMYQFSYNSDNNPLKKALGLHYKGAAHVEDMTYVFKLNSGPVDQDPMDHQIIELMTSYVLNFIKNDHPNPTGECWPPITCGSISYQKINSADPVPSMMTPYQREMVKFFEDILPQPTIKTVC